MIITKGQNSNNVEHIDQHSIYVNSVLTVPYGKHKLWGHVWHLPGGRYVRTAEEAKGFARRIAMISNVS